jgi:hypothetical protein
MATPSSASTEARMTIITSKGERIVFEPFKSVVDGPKFHLRGGDTIERGIMEGELAGPPYMAREVQPWEFTIALRAGVETLLAGDDGLGEILDLINAAAQGGDRSLEEAQRQKLNQVRAIMAEHWPDYASLVATDQRRRTIAPIVAFRRYCVGIEGNASKEAGPVDFKVDVLTGFVSDDTLKQVDPLLMTFAGNEAFMLQYGGGQVKNSERLSKSGENPQDSKPAAQSKAAGSSAKKPGQKTRASSSRRGRSR